MCFRTIQERRSEPGLWPTILEIAFNLIERRIRNRLRCNPIRARRSVHGDLGLTAIHTRVTSDVHTNMCAEIINRYSPESDS